MGFTYKYNRALCKISPFWQRRLDRALTYATPGNVMHVAKLKRVPVGLFKRWCDRPEKAKALYWRLHPNERS